MYVKLSMYGVRYKWYMVYMGHKRLSCTKPIKTSDIPVYGVVRCRLWLYLRCCWVVVKSNIHTSIRMSRYVLHRLSTYIYRSALCGICRLYLVNNLCRFSGTKSGTSTCYDQYIHNYGRIHVRVKLGSPARYCKSYGISTVSKSDDRRKSVQTTPAFPVSTGDVGDSTN